MTATRVSAALVRIVSTPSSAPALRTGTECTATLVRRLSSVLSHTSSVTAKFCGDRNPRAKQCRTNSQSRSALIRGMAQPLVVTDICFYDSKRPHVVQQESGRSVKTVSGSAQVWGMQSRLCLIRNLVWSELVRCRCWHVSLVVSTRCRFVQCQVTCKG